MASQAQWARILVAIVSVLMAGAACRGRRRSAGAVVASHDASVLHAVGGGDLEAIPTCGQVDPSVPAAGGGSLKVLLVEEPTHLDPLDDPSLATMQVAVGLIYESLVECRAGGYRPGLAEHWEWNEDRSLLQLQLRSDLHWEDGQPVTTTDVQASLQTALRDRQSPTAAALAGLKAIETGPPGTVRLRLSGADAGVLDALCDLPIIPAALARGARRKNLREHPIGTGPFRLAAWERGRRIRLVRSPTSWRRPAGVEEVVFEVEPDGWRGLVRARNGQVDIAAVADRHYPDQVRRAALASTVSLRRLPEQRLSFLAINHRHPPLSDLSVRRALNHLWNRAGLSEELHQGLARPIADPLARGAPPAFDPKLAIHLLEESGWQDDNGDGVRERQGAVLQIGLLHAAAAGSPAEVELRRFAAGLFRAGIRLELTAVEPAVLLQRLRGGDFDLAALSWRGRAGEDPTPLLTGDGRFHPGGFRSARIDALLADWRRADPGETRDRISQQLAAAVAEEVPSIFLYRHDQLLLVHRRVRGLCNEGGRLDLRRVSVQDGPSSQKKGEAPQDLPL